MCEIEVLADYEDCCGECPVWDAVRRRLYWTDITRRRFLTWSREQGSGVLWSGFEVASFVLDENGGFLVANSSGFWLWHGEENPELILDSVDGKACVLNDCTADPAGRVLAGSCFYDGSEHYASGFLFSLDSDRSGKILDDGLRLSNGLGFSPDQSTLYVTDSAGRRIYAYDYRVSDGSVSKKRVFVQVPGHQGIPDGLTVDADGFVWSAQWFGGCLMRYDADGRLERRVEMPASQMTSMAFGGANLTDLFVTSAAVPDALPLAPAGYDPAEVYNGGKLFRLNVGIPGKEEYRSRIGLCRDAS